MNQMIKLSAQDAKKIRGTLKTASAAIRKLAAERDALMEVVSRLTTDQELAAVKTAMARKGINPWGTEEAREAELRKIASAGKLDLFKQAVDLSANLSVAKIGEVLDDGVQPGGSAKRSESSRQALDEFVMNGG